MARHYLLMCGTLLLWSVQAQGQISWRVAIDQLSRPHGAASAIPQPVSSSSRAAPAVEGSGRSGPSEELVRACREAALRGVALQGADCAAILQSAEAQGPQASGEGTLLQMFGRNPNVSGGSSARGTGATGADAVARQLSTGDGQGAAASDAAAGVAARQRVAPPPRPPR